MSPGDRMIQRRLAWFRHAEEVTRNVAKTCRYYGISRNTYYTWYRRYGEVGSEGLRDRSRRPHSHPRTTPAEVWEKVLYLRRYYHFGPAPIQMYLQRYHVKFLEPLPARRRYYQYTAIDDCTRVRVLKIYERNTQQMAIAFVDDVLSQLPFAVQCIQTDNGSEFGSQFHWHLLDKGIQHHYIRPRRPYLNGKTERFHRIDDEGFYRQMEGVVISTAEEFNQRLQEWERFYNYERPHGGLNGHTPYERLRERLGVCPRIRPRTGF